jgi:hypothetical protein
MHGGWSRELGIVVEGLIPERQLRMVSVVVGDDVITVHYRISPALPAHDPDTGRPLWLTWDWHGVDDLGNDVHLAPFSHDEGDLGAARVGIPLRPQG